MRSIAHVSEQMTMALSRRPERERPEAVRVADGDETVAREHHQREGALDLRHGFDDRLLDVVRLRSGVEMQDHLGIAVGLEDRSLLHQLVAQLARVDEVAVVAERDLAVRAIDQNRLRVQLPALAGRRIRTCPIEAGPGSAESVSPSKMSAT